MGAIGRQDDILYDRPNDIGGIRAVTWTVGWERRGSALCERQDTGEGGGA